MRLTGKWEYCSNSKKIYCLKMYPTNDIDTVNLHHISEKLFIDYEELIEYVIKFDGELDIYKSDGSSSAKVEIHMAKFHDPRKLGDLIQFLQPWVTIANLVGG